MKNLYYVKRGPTGYTLYQIDDNQRVRDAASMAKIRLRGKIVPICKCPVKLKAMGYKGNYNDVKGEILKMVPPELAEKAVGFSLKLAKGASTVDYFDYLEGEVTLYKNKSSKKLIKKRKLIQEDSRQTGDDFDKEVWVYFDFLKNSILVVGKKITRIVL